MTASRFGEQIRVQVAKPTAARLTWLFPALPWAWASGARRGCAARDVGAPRVWAGPGVGVGGPPRADLGGTGARWARAPIANEERLGRSPAPRAMLPAYPLGAAAEGKQTGKRWAERARLPHARTVQDIEFAPKHLGLKLVRAPTAWHEERPSAAKWAALSPRLSTYLRPCRPLRRRTAWCASTRLWTS